MFEFTQKSVAKVQNLSPKLFSHTVLPLQTVMPPYKRKPFTVYIALSHPSLVCLHPAPPPGSSEMWIRQILRSLYSK